MRTAKSLDFLPGFSFEGKVNFSTIILHKTVGLSYFCPREDGWFIILFCIMLERALELYMKLIRIQSPTAYRFRLRPILSNQ